MPQIPVHKSVNKLLTVWGVDRRLFFLAMIMGAATFTAFSTLVGAALMFAVLYGLARQATKHDPQILRIIINASKFTAQYDPSKRQQYGVQIIAAPRHNL